MSATPRTLLILILTIVFSTAVPAQDRREIPDYRVVGDPTGNEAAVNQLLNEFRTAWAEQDAASMMALHSKDTEWINAYARMFQSRSALGDFVEQRLFPGFDPQVSRDEMASLGQISTRYMGDDAAVLHLYLDSRRGVSRNSGEQARRVHMHLVLSKQAGEWKIVHTVIMDARS